MGREPKPPGPPPSGEMHDPAAKEGHDALRARNGDAYGALEAYSDAYLRDAPLLRKIAVTKFHVPPADAEALVHDVFTTYMTNSNEVNVVDRYLVGAICNASRHYHRRAKATNALFCDDTVCASTPSDAILDEIARKSLLSKILARIGARCRDLLYR